MCDSKSKFENFFVLVNLFMGLFFVVKIILKHVDVCKKREKQMKHYIKLLNQHDIDI